jgi:hypothetical protein
MDEMELELLAKRSGILVEGGYVVGFTTGMDKRLVLLCMMTHNMLLITIILSEIA